MVRRFYDRCSLVGEPRQFTGSFFQRFFPSERYERGGQDDFDEEAHFFLSENR